MTAAEIETVDYHTGGEPFRIFTGDLPFEAMTVAGRRVEAIHSEPIDRLRKVLCFEPRGHADMYGGFVVPPDDDGASFGVLFWHKDGYSTACGHGTMALGAWAVESGLVDAHPSGITDVSIDVPSGRVVARVHSKLERVSKVDFLNVASYPIDLAVPVATTRGDVNVSVSCSGAIYAQVRAGDLGLAVEPRYLSELIALGREIKRSLSGTEVARHPEDERLGGIYGVIFWDDLGTDSQGRLHQRNVTVFADGEVDRSPCGSGTGSRLATLTAEGSLTVGAELVHDSIVGSRFIGSVSGVEVTPWGARACLPIVSGTTYRTGRHSFVVDPDDPLVPGFVLR
jgi:proline racemase